MKIRAFSSVSYPDSLDKYIEGGARLPRSARKAVSRWKRLFDTKLSRQQRFNKKFVHTLRRRERKAFRTMIKRLRRVVK